MGLILVTKILRRGSHVDHQNCQKLVKSTVFEIEKPLEMGSDLRKLKKKMNQPFFEGEKSLDMGRGLRPRAAHSVIKK